jgi:D-arabinose 1-dehydrogenase-like Zn-dependent alcohol dehydrogenase
MTVADDHMSATVLEEFGTPPVATRIPRPLAAPGEALIRVRAAGLCGTDLKVASGDRSRTRSWAMIAAVSNR